MNLFLIAIYVFTPAAVLWLCRKITFLNKIGPVLLLYLLGIILGNSGLISLDTFKLQDTIVTILIPLAIPLMLFSSNFLRWNIKSALITLATGVFAVICSIIAGYFIFEPLIGKDPVIGSQMDKIAGMLAGVYTGGTPNLAAIKIMLDLPNETYIMLHSYDMAISLLYLTFVLSAGIGLFRKFLNHSSNPESDKSQSRSLSHSGSSPSYEATSNEFPDNPYKGFFKKSNLKQVSLVVGLSILIFAVAGGLSFVLPKNLQMAVVILTITSLGIAASFVKALEMSDAEKRERMMWMQRRVSKQTVNKWAGDFIRELQSVREKNLTLFSRVLSNEIERGIISHYNNSQNRLILLDYDGTLSAFKPKPEDAVPTIDIIKTLELLASDSRNTVVISSGRDHSTLDSWLGFLNIGLAAEHGALYKESGEWHKNNIPATWDEEILNILQQYVEKTPRSSLEVKETALVWHYRKVDAWLASMRVQQLISALVTPCTREHLQIMRGNKIIEVKHPDFTKGSEVNRLLKKKSYDFILAMGDDITDEDMFFSLPDTAFTVKIGTFSEYARYNLLNQTETLPFLNRLAGSGKRPQEQDSLKDG
jgi:trehalose-phosphatase